MLEDLQLLPADKKRETDHEILKTHLETLLLLTATRECRETLRKVKVYPVIRELHVDVEDDGVRESVDRLVQVLMRDEEDEAASGGIDAEDHPRNGKSAVKDQRVEEVDSDDEVVEVM